MRRTAFALASIAVGIAGCGVLGESALPWPIDPDAVTDAGLMIVEPAAAAPGEIVEISFSEDWPRGVLYALDGLEDRGWRRLAYLVSDANGGSPNSWPVGETEGMVVEFVGITGLGPERIEVPAMTPPGAYRICTAMGSQNLCTPLEVTGP